MKENDVPIKKQDEKSAIKIKTFKRKGLIVHRAYIKAKNPDYCKKFKNADNYQKTENEFWQKIKSLEDELKQLYGSKKLEWNGNADFDDKTNSWSGSYYHKEEDELTYIECIEIPDCDTNDVAAKNSIGWALGFGNCPGCNRNWWWTPKTEHATLWFLSASDRGLSLCDDCSKNLPQLEKYKTILKHVEHTLKYMTRQHNLHHRLSLMVLGGECLNIKWKKWEKTDIKEIEIYKKELETVKKKIQEETDDLITALKKMALEADSDF